MPHVPHSPVHNRAYLHSSTSKHVAVFSWGGQEGKGCEGGTGGEGGGRGGEEPVCSIGGWMQDRMLMDFAKNVVSRIKLLCLASAGV